MSRTKKGIFEIIGMVKSQSKKGTKDYGSGLAGEHLIVSAYKTMPLAKLEAMRSLINEIIKEKKIYRRIQGKDDTANTDIADDLD